MSKIKWDKSLSVRHDVIDKQHRRFIETANELYEKIMQGNIHDIRVARGKALEDIEDYLVHHFATEEQFLTDMGYPGIADHMKLHREFTAKIRGYRRDIDNGRLMLTSDLMKTLLHWFSDHLLNEDMKYAAFNSERNA